MKACYSRGIAGYGDFEIAETFFNSITRRIFATVGVDPGCEYVDSDFNAPPARSPQPVYHTYLPTRPTAEWLRQVLAAYAFAADYADLERDAALAAGEIDAHLRAVGLHPIEAVETLKAIFYRNTGGYIVGRMRSGGRMMPLVLALRHPPAGHPPSMRCSWTKTTSASSSATPDRTFTSKPNIPTKRSSSSGRSCR